MEMNHPVLSELDNDGRFRKNVLNLELGLGTSDLAQNRFEQQLEDGPVLAADLKHFATLQTLLKKLLNVLQVSFDDGSLINLDYCYDNQQILDSGFIDWVEERRDVLQGIVTIPSLSFMKSNPLSFVSTILQKMGHGSNNPYFSEH